MWLKMAARGFWGGTIGEPLDWYRRRSAASSTSTWSAWRNPPDWRARYPALLSGATRKSVYCLFFFIIMLLLFRLCF